MILKLEILNREILIDTSFVLLCLSIVCLPINKEIAGPFRLTDIFLVLSVASIITKIKLSQPVFQLLVGLAVILAVSSVLGVLAYGITNLSNIGFVYKFIVPIMPVLILGTVRIGPKGIVLLHRILFYVFLFLVGWVYLYLALRLTGRINGVLRPSFPFSSDYYQSDAHLYSSYLAMCLIMYNFYWRNLFGQKYFWLIFVNLVALPAIILTGSRTGIVLVGFAQIFSSLISLKKIFYLRKSTFFIAVLFIGIGLYFMSKVSFDVATLRLIERAFEFNAGEESSGSRVRKLLLSFDQTSGTMFIFGVGLLANYVTWYDGLIGSTNGFMGIAGLVLIFVVIVQIIRLNYLNAVKNGTLSLFNPFIIVFASYLIANLITEYYLVTRGVLPTALFLMLLHIQIANSSDRQLSKTSA